MDLSRRNYLAASGSALLAASALSGLAEAAEGKKTKGDVLYGHGFVWNRDLPGVLGELQLTFDLRVNLESGTGFGTAQDPVHPDFNMHFSIDSVQKEKQRKGEVRYSMTGNVTQATDPGKVGLPVRIVAQTVGDTTAIAIRIGDLAFAGAGLVVIAIIAILIAMLLPAVQK